MKNPFLKKNSNKSFLNAAISSDIFWTFAGGPFWEFGSPKGLPKDPGKGPFFFNGGPEKMKKNIEVLKPM